MPRIYIVTPRELLLYLYCLSFTYLLLCRIGTFSSYKYKYQLQHTNHNYDTRNKTVYRVKYIQKTMDKKKLYVITQDLQSLIGNRVDPK